MNSTHIAYAPPDNPLAVGVCTATTFVATVVGFTPTMTSLHAPPTPNPIERTVDCDENPVPLTLTVTPPVFTATTNGDSPIPLVRVPTDNRIVVLTAVADPLPAYRTHTKYKFAGIPKMLAVTVDVEVPLMTDPAGVGRVQFE